MRAALFLDRDGVINEDIGYLHRPEDCRFIPGIFDLVRRARDAGMLVVVVTNQAGIARGYYTEQQYQSFTQWMCERFEAEEAPITAVYHCPHHPVAGLGDYKQVCSCRKPEPGMLMAARDAHQIDLERSALVGDSATDMAAAVRAGISSRYLLAREGKVKSHPDCTVVSELAAIQFAPGRRAKSSHSLHARG